MLPSYQNQILKDNIKAKPSKPIVSCVCCFCSTCQQPYAYVVKVVFFPWLASMFLDWLCFSKQDSDNLFYAW